MGLGFCEVGIHLSGQGVSYRVSGAAETFSLCFNGQDVVLWRMTVSSGWVLLLRWWRTLWRSSLGDDETGPMDQLHITAGEEVEGTFRRFWSSQQSYWGCEQRSTQHFTENFHHRRLKALRFYRRFNCPEPLSVCSRCVNKSHS